MSCSVAVASSPVFSPQPSRNPLSCRPSPEGATRGSPSPSPSPRGKFPGSPLRSVSCNGGCGGVIAGFPLLKRKRPAMIDIPMTEGFPEAVLKGSDGRREVEEESATYGVYCKRGKRRLEMEDRHTAVVDISSDPNTAFFGIFDGHGGTKAAEFASARMGEAVVEELRTGGGETCYELEGAVRTGYLRTDEEFLKQDADGGACCVTALLHNGDLVVSNAGDCRAVLCRSGQADVLTSDHRASREDERERIENSGGFVMNCRGMWRVQGSLAVTRGIGDQHLKEWVIPEPETTSLHITPQCEFLILASDGLWDKVNNQEAVDVAHTTFHNTNSRTSVLSVCKKLADLSTSRGSADDISVMIILLQKFSSEKDAYDGDRSP